jgi:hypothetical protein
MKLVIKGLFAGLVCVLAACGNNAEKAADAPAPAAATAETYTWNAIAPSTVEAGPPATATLSGGYAYALLSDTAVLPGDAVTARMTLQGEAGRFVRVIVQRHCDTENGGDAQSQNVQLTGQPQAVEVSHSFQQTYSCLRVSFVSSDGQALPVTISDLTVTKAASGLRETQGG